MVCSTYPLSLLEKVKKWYYENSRVDSSRIFVKEITLKIEKKYDGGRNMTWALLEMPFISRLRVLA